MVTIDQIKKLREETGISLTECKKALGESKGNIERAKEILRKWGGKVAGKKAERTAGEGIVESYIHSNKKVGVLLDIGCESDFVAKSEEFQKLAHEICLQIAAMNPLFVKKEEIPEEFLSEEKNKEEVSLLSQPWIKDETKNIKGLIDEYTAKIGENIVIRKFTRYEI